jgi:hypothetical protein
MKARGFGLGSFFYYKKILFQKFSSKNSLPKILFQKFSSKNSLPKILFQKFSSKNDEIGDFEKLW